MCDYVLTLSKCEVDPSFSGPQFVYSLSRGASLWVCVIVPSPSAMKRALRETENVCVRVRVEREERERRERERGERRAPLRLSEVGGYQFEAARRGLGCSAASRKVINRSSEAAAAEIHTSSISKFWGWFLCFMFYYHCGRKALYTRQWFIEVFAPFSTLPEKTKD